MPSPYDFHIHTTHLKCANETMTVPALVERCESLGLEAIAITDHLNAPEFMPKHDLIKADLEQIDSPLKIYFGVEVNVIDKEAGAVSIDEEQLAYGGFDPVIGGPHTSYHDTPDRESIIDLQHKLMLAVLANPLVEVLVPSVGLYVFHQLFYPLHLVPGSHENGVLCLNDDEVLHSQGCYESVICPNEAVFCRYGLDVSLESVARIVFFACLPEGVP